MSAEHELGPLPAPFVHLKSGGRYQFVGHARLQTSTPLNDMAYCVVYRGEDGRLWVRPNEEFVDRFCQEDRPSRALCDDFLAAEDEVGGVLAAGGSAPKFKLGDHVRKKSGSAWSGRVVGTYSTALTHEGYAVESDAHPGSVQIYPAAALEKL